MGSLTSLALACVLICNVAAAPEPRAMGSLTGLALAGILVCAALPEPLAEPPRAAALRRCGDLPGCDVDAVERKLAVMAAPCDFDANATITLGIPDGHVFREPSHPPGCRKFHNISIRVEGLGALPEGAELCLTMDVWADGEDVSYACSPAAAFASGLVELHDAVQPVGGPARRLRVWAQTAGGLACLGPAATTSFAVACDAHDAPVSPRSTEVYAAAARPGGCVDTAPGRCERYRELATHVLMAAVPGDYVETGVHVGESAAAVGEVFAAFEAEGRAKARTLWLYDSWEGATRRP